MNKQSLLFTLSADCQSAADLLCDAVCNGCQSCISEISDINRHTLFELSEGERRAMKQQSDGDILRTAHALSQCVTKAFSAAVLLPSSHPTLQPLCEIATASAQLAAYLPKLLQFRNGCSEAHPYSIHLAANKGRGAHALLITNICSTEAGKNLLPLALALEAHRNSLESACNILIERVCETAFG